MSQPPSPPQIGSYRVLRLLGRGGTGTVHAAEHVTSGRRVALKVLHDELSRSRQMVARFFHEARSAARVDDPGIVEVLESGYADDGSAFIAMELLEGESLAARIARGPRLAPSSIVYVGCEIARVVHAAHAQQIVHRDLKPDNIFLVPEPGQPHDTRVKVLDFGMAKLSPEGGPYSFVTEKGALLGTPMYMAPEQCRGGDVDGRADVYALGCILYELACGQPPFVRGGMGMILGAHVYQPVPPPRLLAPDVPEALERVLLRALEKSRDARYPTMQALAQELGAVGADHGQARASR